MPIANLQSYRTVALRVRTNAGAARGLAQFLESAVTQRLREGCSFSSIGRVGPTPADIVIDLNITNRGRGTHGMISNPNAATLDTLLVLTDGQTRDLMGTARIHGESSGVQINGRNPNTEAVDAVAKAVADVLGKSGCSGPRVARVDPPPPPGPTHTTGTGTTGTGDTGTGTGTPPVDESKRTDAEALNEQGKEKLQEADMQGALILFQQANALLPDAKYEFNSCLALEALEQWDNAISACKKARGMGAEPRLVAKIDHRLELLSHHQ